MYVLVIVNFSDHVGFNRLINLYNEASWLRANPACVCEGRCWTGFWRIWLQSWLLLCWGLFQMCKLAVLISVIVWPQSVRKWRHVFLSSLMSVVKPTMWAKFSQQVSPNSDLCPAKNNWNTRQRTSSKTKKAEAICQYQSAAGGGDKLNKIFRSRVLV